MKRIGFLFALIILSIICIPSVHAYDTGREVYVRHINRDTGAIITNLSNTTQEVIDINGNQSLLTNGRSDDAEIEYNEYYNFDVSATMNITKSLVVKSEGKNYKYLGANVCTMYSLDEAYEIMEQKKNAFRAGTAGLDIEYNDTSNTSYFVTKQTQANDVTIVDFYYTEQSSTEVSPRLLSNTNVWTGNDASMLSDITYVPAGGSVLPYFVTPKYVIKDLSYEKIIENGEVYYKVNNFKV